MKQAPQIKLDVPNRDVFDKLLSDSLPLGLTGTELEHTFHRDVYFDSKDKTLARRKVGCRLRTCSDDSRVLSLEIRETTGNGTVLLSQDVFAEEVPEVDPHDALRGNSEPARRLRALIDPDRLEPTIELETERWFRRARPGVFSLWRFTVAYDVVTVRGQEASQEFHEVKIRRLRRGAPSLEQLARAFQERYALRTTLAGKVERAFKQLTALESQALARQVQGGREVAVIATFRGELALRRDGNALALPGGEGSGEETCRGILREHFGTVEAKVRLLGTAPAAGTRPPLEVWLADALPPAVATPPDDAVQWFTLAEIMRRVGSPLLRDARTLAALAVAGRTDLLHITAELPAAERQAPPPPPAPDAIAPDAGAQTIADLQRPELPEASLDAAQPVPDQFINQELSWLEFNARVLELAEDPGTPLLARLRFLGIFSSNLDEFVMVRIGDLKDAAAKGVTETRIDGLTPQEQLDAITIRLSPLVSRQRRCFHELRPELKRHGVALRTWADLSEDEQQAMREHFDEQIFPVLTPQALTRAPGHPFPHIANLSVSLAAMVRDHVDGPVHFAHIRVPSGLSRFVTLPNGRDRIPLEDVIAANLAALYPGRSVEEVHAFRITRSGDIHVDEEGAANLLQAIEEEVRRRPFGSVIRIEVDRDMPQVMRELLERELQFEQADQVATLSAADVYETEGLLDLTALSELASLPMPELDYPSFTPAAPIASGKSIFESIAEHEVLVHHPYDSFEATVERFIVEAAADPDVIAIKLTLYRSGRQSPIVDALMRAAREGKEVAVFVELKARFDEERNIQWAKKLERAGIHVVYGLVRLKTHAKTTLVVRREGGSVRRYVHVGTGNYNATTSKLYTDLGLLSCRDSLGADLNDLFNELTGSSRPPQSKFRDLLVAPKRMRKRFLKLIAREAEHAQEGRGGRIRVKINGLADKEIIGALYWASQMGVQIDLIVRGICSLRPGVPGLSDRIRVFSVLGRFLEHARIYYFANGGEADYYIGSADWRPRNLRRRVEVVIPVVDAAACDRLDRILELELDDPLAWQMNSDGSYVRRPAQTGVDQRTAQEYWVEQLTPSPLPSDVTTT